MQSERLFELYSLSLGGRDSNRPRDQSLRDCSRTSAANGKVSNVARLLVNPAETAYPIAVGGKSRSERAGHSSFGAPVVFLIVEVDLRDDVSRDVFLVGLDLAFIVIYHMEMSKTSFASSISKCTGDWTRANGGHG